jgi:hypothetical protein
MAHPAPVNGGDLALGPGHVTLRHLAILLIIALVPASRTLQRERASFARALAVVAGQAQDLESSGQAIVPEPAARASAGQLLAVC